MNNQVDTVKNVLAQYTDGRTLLEQALSGLSDTDLDLTLDADSWSIRQIVHHVTDGDDIWKTCIKTALGNSDALFSLQWYTAKSQMEWSKSWAHSCRGLASSLELYRANRHHILDLLKHVPGALEKSVRFDRPAWEEIRITIFDVVELHIRHLAEHIESINAMRQARGA